MEIMEVAKLMTDVDEDSKNTLNALSKKELIIGAHMPIGGGFAKVPRETVEIGGNAFQIFPHNPRQWAARMPSDDDVVHFLRDVKKYELNPEYFMCIQATLSILPAQKTMYGKNLSNYWNWK